MNMIFKMQHIFNNNFNNLKYHVWLIKNRKWIIMDKYDLVSTMTQDFLDM